MITPMNDAALDIEDFVKSLADAGISVAEDDLASAFETAQWLSRGLKVLAQAYPDLLAFEKDG